MCLLQSCLGQYLVRWVAWCGAAAVRLKVKEDFATGCFFDLNVVYYGVPGTVVACVQPSAVHSHGCSSPKRAC